MQRYDEAGSSAFRKFLSITPLPRMKRSQMRWFSPVPRYPNKGYWRGSFDWLQRGKATAWRGPDGRIT